MSATGKLVISVGDSGVGVGGPAEALFRAFVVVPQMFVTTAGSLIVRLAAYTTGAVIFRIRIGGTWAEPGGAADGTLAATISFTGSGLQSGTTVMSSIPAALTYLKVTCQSVALANFESMTVSLE